MNQGTSHSTTIGARRQLFVDDHIVDRVDNVRRQLHRPVRYDGNPLVEADQPWEQGGNGVSLLGGTVLYDEEDRLFKMWYRNSRVARASSSEGFVEPERRGYTSCYAVSEDGLTWEKPVIGQTKFDGSVQNNILPPAIDGKAFIRRPNLIKDYDEPDPDRRYKMAYMDEVDGRWVLSKAYSADGINWRMNVGQPTYFERPVIPNGILFGWDPRVERYVLLHRKTTKVRADVDGRLVRQDTALVRSVSRDFGDWGETEEIPLRRETDPPSWEPSHLSVLAAALYTDDLYVGFLDTATTHCVEDVPAEMWETVYRHEHAEHRNELVVSRDGLHWTRVAPHWEFLRPGLWGTWDDRIVGPVKPIILGEEILIYYTGRNLPCGAQLPEHPQSGILNRIIDGRRMGYAIGLARMRLDGFASMDGHEPGGTLTTKSLVFKGDRLYVNARAPERPLWRHRGSIVALRGHEGGGAR